MSKKLTESDIYKAVSDLINESYDWISDGENKEAAGQYVLGINDMARYLIDKLNEGLDEGLSINE